MSKSDNHHDAKHPLSPAQYAALGQTVSRPENKGDDLSWSCDFAPKDHLHLRRLGAPGSGLEGRVGVLIHSGVNSSPGLTVYLAADEARTVAAALLNIADELDGTTPLVFFPERRIDPDTADKPES